MGSSSSRDTDGENHHGPSRPSGDPQGWGASFFSHSSRRGFAVRLNSGVRPMFFTHTQFMLLAALALLYIASTFVAVRSKGQTVSYISTFLGCFAFLVGAFLAAKNLLFLLTTTEPVHSRWGKTLAHEFILSPSEDPLVHALCLILQAGTICLLLVLAYSVYSHRPRKEA
jgi:hypothetical protein